MRLYPKRMQPLVDRGNRFLKGWEWTWTSAVVFALTIAWLGIIILAVIPSFWLYFANSVLHWDASFWLSKARDAIAAGWITTWFAIFFLLGYLLQEQRKRLRGTGGGTRPAGGYR